MSVAPEPPGRLEAKLLAQLRATRQRMEALQADIFTKRDGPTYGVGDILHIDYKPYRITKVDGDTISYVAVEPYAQRPTEHLLREEP